MSTKLNVDKATVKINGQPVLIVGPVEVTFERNHFCHSMYQILSGFVSTETSKTSDYEDDQEFLEDSCFDCND